MVVWDRESGPVPENADIVLTSDLGLAEVERVPQGELTVVALPPSIDLERCGDPSGIPSHVLDVSRRIEAAYAYSERLVCGPQGHFSISTLPEFSGLKNGGTFSRKLSIREAALQQAAEVFVSGKAVWHPALFSYDDRNAQTGPTSGELDVTGRPRFLMSGPYLVMPAGVWQAKITLKFDSDASIRRFRVDWGGVEDYATCEFSPGRSGVFEVILTYVWDRPAPAEFRLLLLEGVFHGSVVFGSAEITRISEN
ncbi:hypothetical protein GVN18_32610 [Pseudomonas sp. ODNR1LW]|nr:hypothetical protein [Pseudomonas sp. ODNR1LW]